MTDDEQPQLTNSGLTDPPTEGAAGTTEQWHAATSTPFAATTATAGVAASFATSASSTMTSSGVIVADALEEAAQAIIRPDVPLAMIDELTAAVQGPAVKAALEARVGLIVDHGHTAESDDFLPIGWLPMEARKALEMARDLMNEDQSRDLVAVRAKLIEGAAFVLAAVDRLDRAMKGGQR